MDRAKAGLFDALGALDDVRVLDLFAGSGALGIEALSRGASEAVFVEVARPALVALRANLDALELNDRGRVVAADVRAALRSLAGRAAFDLVLCDPPWNEGWNQRLLDSDALLDLLCDGGLLVLERSGREIAGTPPAALRLRDSRVYGETSFDLYELQGEPAPCPNPP